MSFNKIIIVGNLGKDPELRYTPQGTPVCSFSVATNEKKRAATGEEQSLTTWFRVTLWGKQAESASKYLTKGRPIYVEGRLRVEEWTDRDGKTRQSLEVHATDMQFIGSRGDEGDRDFSSEAGPSEPRRDYRESSSARDSSSQARAVRDDADDFDAGATDEDIPF